MRPLQADFAAAEAVTVGAVVLTFPGRARLDNRVWGAVDRLIAAQAAGFGDLAEHIHADLERRLGVTHDDRLIAGALPDPRKPTPDELVALALAEQALTDAAKPLPKGLTHRQARAHRERNRESRKTAKLAIAAIQARLQTGAEKVRDLEVRKGLAETVKLAGLRKEVLEIGQAPGASGRVWASRTPELSRLWASGHLDGSQVGADGLKRAGEAYRDVYEIAVGKRGPDRSEGAGGVFGSKTPTAPILASTKLEEMRGRPHRKTDRVFSPMTPAQQKACDLICGENLSLPEASRATGAHRDTVARRLRAGLTIIGENLLWW